MFEPLIVLGLFGAVVWAIAHAIFLLVRSYAEPETSNRRNDTMTTFVEQQYGVRFVSENPLGEEGMRKL